MPKYTTLQDLPHSVQDYYNEVCDLNKRLCDLVPAHRLRFDDEVFPPRIREFKARLKAYKALEGKYPRVDVIAVCGHLANAATSGRRSLSSMEKRVLNSYHALPFTL